MSDEIEVTDINDDGSETPVVPLRRLYENTPLIRTTDMLYPLFLRDFRKQYPNVTMTVNSIDAYVVAEYNYIEVRLATPPTEGDVITEGKPEFRDDELWYQTWDVRPYNDDEIASNLFNAKESGMYSGNELFNLDLVNGVKVTHSDVDYLVAATPGDRADWGIALATLMNKDNTEVYVVRTTTGFLSMTVAEATVFYHAAIDAYYQLATAYYTYVDLIKNATLITDVPELPMTFVGAVF